MNNLVDFARMLGLIVSDFEAIAEKIAKFIPDDGKKSKKRSVKK